MNLTAFRISLLINNFKWKEQKLGFWLVFLHYSNLSKSLIPWKINGIAVFWGQFQHNTVFAVENDEIIWLISLLFWQLDTRQNYYHWCQVFDISNYIKFIYQTFTFSADKHFYFVSEFFVTSLKKFSCEILSVEYFIDLKAFFGSRK